MQRVVLTEFGKSERRPNLRMSQSSFIKNNTSFVDIRAHAHFLQSSNNVINVFTCLSIVIKSTIHHMVTK